MFVTFTTRVQARPEGRVELFEFGYGSDRAVVYCHHRDQREQVWIRAEVCDWEICRSSGRKRRVAIAAVQLPECCAGAPEDGFVRAAFYTQLEFMLVRSLENDAAIDEILQSIEKRIPRPGNEIFNELQTFISQKRLSRERTAAAAAAELARMKSLLEGIRERRSQSDSWKGRFKAGGDPFLVLNVPHSSSRDELKRAFRRRVFREKLHPDLSDAPEQLELFLILRDALERALEIVARRQ